MPSSRARPLAVASAVLSLLAAGTTSSAPSSHAPQPPRARSTACEDVHIFLARGWKEDYPGRQGVLVDAICAGTTTTSACGYEDVVFDDSATSSYGPAVYQGATASIAQITAYADACPDAQIVLSGYSEGAHALGDALAGGGGDYFGLVEGDVTGIASDTTSPGNKIAAVLLWGDPRHTASQSCNVRSGSGADGYFPRSGANLANLNIFSSVARSYCLAGDTVCASGDDDSVHTSYFESSLGLVDDAAEWVRSKVGISATATTAATTTGVSSTASAGTSKTSTAGSSSSESATTSSSHETSSATSTVSSSSSSGSSGSGASSATSTGTATGSSAASTATSGGRSVVPLGLTRGGPAFVFVGVMAIPLGAFWLLI